MCSLSPVVSTKKQREELDRNVQLQVLIASVLQCSQYSTDTEKNQIGMCSYKSLLTQLCSRYSQTGELNQMGMCSYKSLLPQSSISTRRHREELDRNVQLRVLRHSSESVEDGDQIGMCSYKSLLPQSLQSVLTDQREELDRNVQLQVLIAFSPTVSSVIKNREKTQIGMVQLQVLID